MRTRIFGGLGLLLALSLFFNAAAYAANDYPYFGPQPYDDDYVYFGNADYPADQPHGLTLTVSESSLSFQSVIAYLSVDANVIEDRGITEFYIMANGRLVDYINPAWDMEHERYKRYYRLRIKLDDWNIGSLINLQVVAATHAEDNPANPAYQNQYVVAWSGIEGPYQLKPLPVIDRDAITVLQQILNKLDAMKSSLEAKLNQVTKAVEDIYTPTPAAEQQLQAAMDRLQDKLPMQEIFDKTDEINQTLDRSLQKLKRPGERLYLGGEFEMIPGVAQSKVRFLDLTEWREQVLLFRRVCEAAIWVYFFYMLLEKVTPKPRL